MYLCQGRIFLESSAYRLFQQYRPALLTVNGFFLVVELPLG
jgi:hypothetical protein